MLYNHQRRSEHILCETKQTGRQNKWELNRKNKTHTDGGLKHTSCGFHAGFKTGRHHQPAISHPARPTSPSRPGLSGINTVNQRCLTGCIPPLVIPSPSGRHNIRRDESKWPQESHLNPRGSSVKQKKTNVGVTGWGPEWHQMEA